MNEHQDDQGEIVPLGEARSICREELGMSDAEFRHELAEHVRGNGGIPWVATETTVGVYRAALRQFVRDARTSPEEEMPND
ncbi:MAG: hypothetical protein WBF17_03660 [Phycisphaerae bacterium]